MRFVDLRPAEISLPIVFTGDWNKQRTDQYDFLISDPVVCSADRVGAAVVFDCPHCYLTHAAKPKRMACFVSNPTDGKGILAFHGTMKLSTTIIKDLAQAASVSSIGDGRWVVDQDVIESMTPHLWVRGGLSWETLSLTPNSEVEGDWKRRRLRNDFPGCRDWFGSVIDGEVVHAKGHAS